MTTAHGEESKRRGIRLSRGSSIFVKMKRDYEINENNCRSARFQRAWLPGTVHSQAMHAGSVRIGSYFRLFRNLSSFLISISLIASGQRRPGPEETTIDILITGGMVVTIDPERHAYSIGFIAIRGNRIIDVGDMARPQASKFRPTQTIDARNRSILPGLINTHTHIPMTLFRGIADDLDLQEWLTKYIFPAEAKNVTRDFVVAGTRLGLIEMIRGGTTTYVDMYYFEDAVAEESKRAGLRGVLGETVIDCTAPDNKTWEAGLAYTRDYIKKWKGDSLITPAIAPHAPYTVNTQHLNEARSVAEMFDVPLIMHMAEAPTESDYMAKTYQ